MHRNTEALYLCVLEETSSGFSGFMPDVDSIYASGRTKSEVLRKLSEGLSIFAKLSELPEARFSKDNYPSEEGKYETEYVSIARPNDVSLKLEEIIKESGLKIKDVASRLNVSSAAVSRMTSPDYRNHTIGSLRNIADVLGYEVEVSFKKLNN